MSVWKISSWLRQLSGEAGQTVASSSQRGAHQVSSASKLMLWAIFAVFAVLFAWAAVADVETVTRAEGRVVPTARLQTIQKLFCKIHKRDSWAKQKVPGSPKPCLLGPQPSA